MKKKIELLFQKILLTIGIGAKTNVGYGQFEEIPENVKINSNNHSGKFKENKETKKPENNYQKIEPSIPDECKNYLTKDATFSAKIIDQKEGYNYFTFEVNNKQCCLRKKITNNPELKVGDNVKVKFNQPFQSIENPQCKLI